MPSTSAGSARLNALSTVLKNDQRRLIRRAQRAEIVVLATCLVATLIGLAAGLATALGDATFAVVFVGLLAIVLPVQIALIYVFALRPGRPFWELAMLTVDSARQNWAALDGVPRVPATPEAMLDRVGDRTDNLATLLRVGALWQTGDLPAARAAMAGWMPGDDPVDRARHARWTELLAYEDTGVDGLAAVKPIVQAVPDTASRQRQLASMAIEEAARRAQRGEPALEGLAEARGALGDVDFPTFGWQDRLRSPGFRFGLIFAISWLPVIGVLLVMRQ